MLRKLCRGIVAAVLALSVFSTGALAAMPQYPGLLGHCNVFSKAACADGNGDGVCDIHGIHCRRFGHSVKRTHMCRKPGDAGCSWHFSSDGCWVRCADADCNGFCDTCGAVFPVSSGNVGGVGNTAGNGGSSSGNSGSAGSSGNSYGSSGSAGNGYYGHHSGHHSGHHGGHC